MKRRARKGEQGNVILYALLFLFICSAAAMIAIDAIRNRYSTAVDDELKIRAHLLSNNLLDLTQFMLLYDKIIYTDAKGPLDHSGASGTEMVKLWSATPESINSAAIFVACGGFDAVANPIGQFVIGGRSVFCPSYLRSPYLSSAMLEQMVLEPMVDKGKLNRIRPGVYGFELVYFNDGANNLDPARSFVGMPPGQDLIKTGRLVKATINVEIMTSSAGFDSLSAKRFISLTSLIEVKRADQNPFSVRHTKSFLMYSSTPQDFNLFMVYPARADGTATRRMSESLIIPPSARIKGRVFFNGDIDIPLPSLPVFEEAVIVTGKFIPPLTLADLPLVRSKFKKGVLTGFSWPRFVATGACSGTNPSVKVENSGGFPCRQSDGVTPYGISDYLLNVSSLCTEIQTESREGQVIVTCSPTDFSGCSFSCEAVAASSGVAGGPLKQLSVRGAYALVSAGVGRADISASNVYGMILGGHVQASGSLRAMHSMSAVSLGMPGLGSQPILDAYSLQYRSAAAGVSSPLVNMPIVYSGDAQ